MTEIMEFSLSEVINSLINNRPSPAMASYCLLLKKLLRYQKDHKRAQVRYYDHEMHKVLPEFYEEQCSSYIAHMKKVVVQGKINQKILMKLQIHVQSQETYILAFSEVINL